MAQLPDWQSADLTQETLYDVDKALPFWLQFPPWSLIRVLVHDLRNEIGIVRTLMQAIRGDPNLASAQIARLGNQTVLEAGDIALARIDRILKILTIASHCERSHNPDETN